MTCRHWFIAEDDVALGADKRRALVFLIYLVIENSTIIRSRSNVTTFSATARFDRNFLHRDALMTLRALKIGMGFMSKRAC